MPTIGNAILGLSALVAFTIGDAGAANLVVNGAFDNTAAQFHDNTGTGGDDLYLGGTVVTGWSSVPGFANELWIAPTNGYQLTASPGNGSGYFIDLTGQVDGNKPYGGIQQTIATVAGTTYRMSFDLGASTLYDGSGLGASALTASATGTSVLASQLFTLEPTGANQWVTETLTFKANSSSTTIALLADSDYTSRYVGLDNVAVAAVPEPETWALMLAGLGIAGVISRRRR